MTATRSWDAVMRPPPAVLVSGAPAMVMPAADRVGWETGVSATLSSVATRRPSASEAKASISGRKRVQSSIGGTSQTAARRAPSSTATVSAAQVARRMGQAPIGIRRGRSRRRRASR